MSKVLPWLPAGVFLALAFLLAVILVKPIGVSTQFVIADAAVWDLVQPEIITDGADSKTGYASSNAYLNKSGGKYAAHSANLLNYSFIFVLAMMAGSLLSSVFKGDRPDAGESCVPHVWQERFGSGNLKRCITVFIAGFLVLFGARLAGGCTSGHMMSGIMQTSLSGYLFAVGVFATSIPLAFFMYKKK